MTNQEILTKVIQKAIDGGWKVEGYPYIDPEEQLNVESVLYYFGDDHGDLSVNDLIWRHDFAKAFWGEFEEQKIVWDEPGKPGKAFGKPGWKRHLQEMVIADDPIKYLGITVYKYKRL